MGVIMNWILVPCLFLFLGVGIGFCINYFFMQKTDAESKLQNKLDRLKLDHKNYQIQVNEHLRVTSDLLDNYKKQHENLETHLFSAKQNFVNSSLLDSVSAAEVEYLSEGSGSSSDNSSGSYSNNSDNIDTKSSPPKDYAAA